MQPFSKIWAVLFLPFTLIYSILSALKNFLYNSKILRPKKVDVPVISIGNLTVGGTGKTPVVAFLANELADRGFKVGIVSRGFRRQSKGTVWVAKEGEILVNALEGGDEPVELAATVKNSNVVVGDSRFEAATELLSKIKVDVILVDDGMQHRKFHRDFEMTVQDVSSASGWKFQLPSGPFRESWKNVRRSDLVLWTKWEHPLPKEKFSNWKSKNSQTHFWAEFIPKEFFYVRENKTMMLKDFSGQKAIAFCGIGQPFQFKKDLEKLGIIVLEFRTFTDHHAYTKQDLLAILELYKDTNAQWIFTTAKDFHRLKATQTTSDFMKHLPCVYLKGHIKVEEGNSLLIEKVLNGIKAKFTS